MEPQVDYASIIDHRHIRMARSGLGLTVRDLAALSSTDKSTIVRIEAGKSVRDSTLFLIREKLESLGARFYYSDSGNCVLVGIVEPHNI